MAERPDAEKVVINGHELPEELYPAFRRLELAILDCYRSAWQNLTPEERAEAEAATNQAKAPRKKKGVKVSDAG